MNILGFFQRLGRALQLPIARATGCSVAAAIRRQPDLLNVPFIARQAVQFLTTALISPSVWRQAGQKTALVPRLGRGYRLLHPHESDGNHQPWKSIRVCWQVSLPAPWVAP